MSWPRIISSVTTTSYDRKSDESTCVQHRDFHYFSSQFMYKRFLPIPNLRLSIEHMSWSWRWKKLDSITV